MRWFTLLLYLMPATISHALSMTTPDDPAYENQPKHWNSTHAATLMAAGSEIIGAFSNSNGISFGTEPGGAVTASHNALTSQSNQNVTAANGGFAFQTLSFSNANNFSFGTSAGSAITGSYTVPSTAGLISNINVSAGTTSNNLSALTFSNLNGVTFGLDGSTITASVAAGGGDAIRGIAAGGATRSTSTVNLQDSNGISFGFGAAGNSTNLTASHNAITSQSNQQMTMFATGNTTQSSTGTTNASSLIFRGEGIASVGITNGSVVVSVPSGGGAGVTISSYENLVAGIFNTTQSVNQASISMAIAFQLPQAGSFSYLRFPVSMTTRSTTIGTTASSRNFSCENYSTWNAVVYSLGVGASSKSLRSVASGSNGWTMRRSISVATNGTQYSVTLGFSGNVEGGGTTRTTQYSISNTNYSFTTNQIATEWSGGRMLDIPFATSLSAGPYWLIFGCSTSSASGGNSSQLSVATNCGAFYSNHFAQTQSNIAIGIMGSTNMTSGGLLGVGSFSTAGGGTTASLPISAISSTASNAKPYFQMLRSA